MAPSPPIWRQVYDAAERAVTPRLESLVRTEHFARGAALATWAQTLARRQVEGVSSRLWHVVNLPAGSDVARLRAQIGALDREVRRLTLKLEQQNHREESRDGTGARSEEGSRPGPPRRRAKRAPGS